MSTEHGICECGRMSAELTRAQLIDVPELARWLATSTRHVRRLVEEHRVPYLKIGHFVRFDPVEISTWIDEQRVSMFKGRAGDNEPIWVRQSLDALRSNVLQTIQLGLDIQRTTLWSRRGSGVDPRQKGKAKMSSIRKKPSGRYEARYRDPGGAGQGPPRRLHDLVARSPSRAAPEDT
jgi:excisionase family DNA binding protein